MSPGDGLRVLVLGAGSIGSRHARNLLTLGVDVWVSDPDGTRVTSISGVHHHVPGLDDLDGFDGVVVATPTLLHREHVLLALESQAKVMVEKPLTASTDGLDDLVVRASDRVMVAFNQRFHEPNQRIVKLAQAGRAGRVLSVRLWSGSYLPEWRPQRDYRQTYSARSELAGGVLLDSIHELDVLIWLLDDRLEVLGAVVDRLGTLEIDVEDTVRALLRHADGAVADVSLDYLSRRYRRGIEVIGEDATLRLDRAREIIEIEDGSGVHAESAAVPPSHSYEVEADRFVSWLRDEDDVPVDAGTGAASVWLAEAIRRHAEERPAERHR